MGPNRLPARRPFALGGHARTVVWLAVGAWTLRMVAASAALGDGLAASVALGLGIGGAVGATVVAAPPGAVPPGVPVPSCWVVAPGGLGAAMRVPVAWAWAPRSRVSAGRVSLQPPSMWCGPCTRVVAVMRSGFNRDFGVPLGIAEEALRDVRQFHSAAHASWTRRAIWTRLSRSSRLRIRDRCVLTVGRARCGSRAVYVGEATPDRERHLPLAFAERCEADPGGGPGAGPRLPVTCSTSRRVTPLVPRQRSSPLSGRGVRAGGANSTHTPGAAIIRVDPTRRHDLRNGPSPVGRAGCGGWPHPAGLRQISAPIRPSTVFSSPATIPVSMFSTSGVHRSCGRDATRSIRGFGPFARSGFGPTAGGGHVPFPCDAGGVGLVEDG